jgi:solute carrier family 35 (UDP-sugar transporter), member A1/2/3
VPSFLYVVQDNLIIYALSCVDAATYQVKAIEFNMS